MNTYRVYALDTSVALEPIVHVVYVRADKYGPAWKGARALLRGETAEGVKEFFTDAEAKVKANISHGDHLTVAKIDDIKPRNVKLDKKALQAIIDDETKPAEERLAAMKALLG